MNNNLDTFICKVKETLGSEQELMEDNLEIQKILPELLLLQNRKETFYGQSWRKRGDIGAFITIARKWDRIENIMEKAMVEGTKTLFDGSSDLSTETVLDTIADLALYSLMWTSYIAKRYPELWNRFLVQNELVVSTDEDDEIQFD